MNFAPPVSNELDYDSSNPYLHVVEFTDPETSLDVAAVLEHATTLTLRGAKGDVVIHDMTVKAPGSNMDLSVYLRTDLLTHLEQLAVERT
jgi:hypothetical protein